MKTWKIVAITGFALIAVALVTASAFAYMGGQVFTPYGTPAGATGPYGTHGGMMGGGMMGGYYGYRSQPNQATPTTPTYPGQYGWGGCHGRAGWNGYSAPGYATNGTAITLDTAVTTAQRYLTSLNNPDIAIAEVEEYTQNFYVLFYEKSTGTGAFEMLIDKYTGSIYPEMGPNMMWNTKYGMMSGGMMGGLRGTTPTAAMTVTASQAKASAQQFLDANYPGTTVGGIDTFYGYYHIDVLSGDNTYGMLSVNGYTGQVWFHNWHGTFVAEVEL